MIDDDELPAEFTPAHPRPKSRRRSVRIRPEDVDDFLKRGSVNPGELRHLPPNWTKERYG